MDQKRHRMRLTRCSDDFLADQAGRLAEHLNEDSHARHTGDCSLVWMMDDLIDESLKRLFDGFCS